MYNWNTDLRKLKNNKNAYNIWNLNQLINFGLNGSKLNLKLVKKYWNQLSLDPKRKSFLSLTLWGKTS